MRKIKAFTALIIVFALMLPVFAYGKTYENQTDLGLTCKSAILMDSSTGDILYEMNSHDKLPPASVTKVMTLLLIFEAIDSGKIKWDDMVTVSEYAASMGGSQVFLEPMEQQSVETMVKCISISSANDASVAMAEYIGGSEQGFVDMMNSRAKELGMNDTNFENACGLDTDGHVTSAHDIALMSRELIKNHPKVSEFATTWMDTIIHKTRKGESEFGLSNTNKLVKWYSGATGLKTGSTGKALFCLSGTAEKDGLSLVAVVMGAPTSAARFREDMQLLDYGFANFTVLNGREKGTAMDNIDVYKGSEETAPTEIAGEFASTVKKGEASEFSEEIVMQDYITAPFEKGEKVGEIIYSIDGEEIGRSDIVTSISMEKINFFEMFEHLILKWLL
ncbi:D-alanyl-D-alanine carboxypeptidase [Anaerotignum faecicola]|nr:D-alanyl-D-alanine carboxypeptidase [Anaerotignum faecicola]